VAAGITLAARSDNQFAQHGKWIVAASVLAGSMMSAIDTNIVNVSLAHIEATYGVTTQEVTWVTTSYLITLVITLPLTNWVASILGRKRMFLAAIAIFSVAEGPPV